MPYCTTGPCANLIRKAAILALAATIAGLSAHYARAAAMPAQTPLRFSLAPPPAGGPACELHGNPAATEEKGPPAGRRPEQGRGGGGRPPQRFESEHRPIPVRTYFLNATSGETKITASILHPDGAFDSLPVERDRETKVTIKLPMADGPGHGAHNVYAVEESLSGDTLLVRSAKWLTIHHNCGWGHDWKFDRDRQTARVNPAIPLEIVADGLWDKNFHSNVMSGDEVKIRVLAHGQPAAGARLTATSEKGWQKTVFTGPDGSAAVQLIRDYYPGSWGEFDRTRLGEILFTAEYEEAAGGSFDGAAFSRTRHVATFPWRYTPARNDYSSYVLGLITVLGGALVSGFGFAFHRRGRIRGIRKQPWN